MAPISPPWRPPAARLAADERKVIYSALNVSVIWWFIIVTALFLQFSFPK
jgi:hypothetical protein